MNSLTVFNYNATEVRTAVIAGAAMFCLKDICDVLEIANVGNVAARLDDRDIHSVDVPTAGGTQQMYFVNEGAMYEVVLLSRKPEAKAFKRWITHDVIPALRKTGTYSVAPAKPKTAMELLAETMSAIQVETAATLAAHDNRLQTIEARAQEADARLSRAALLPPPAEDDVPAITTRAKLYDLARAYAEALDGNHAATWTRLYAEYTRRHHVDLQARARIRSESRRKTVKPLDVAVEDGCIETLYALAYALYAPVVVDARKRDMRNRMSPAILSRLDDREGIDRDRDHMLRDIDIYDA